MLLVLILVWPMNGFSAQSTNSVLNNFEAEFVGLGGSYKMKLDKTFLLCTKSVAGNESLIKVTPTKTQWGEFRETLDCVGAWHWRTNYQNNGVTDGTYWSLSIGDL